MTVLTSIDPTLGVILFTAGGAAFAILTTESGKANIHIGAAFGAAFWLILTAWSQAS